MNRMKTMARSGFTLMEIMVVIIVIAVLASVAGPMIGSITDQGRTSATKANMNNLKTALVNYQNDLGNFPFIGTNSRCATAYNTANSACLNANETTNVLVGNTVTALGFNNVGLSGQVYGRRWRGPYMDSSPDAFMMDSWGVKIHYFKSGNYLYLQSSGPTPGEFDAPYGAGSLNAASPNYEGDDILTTITRQKF